jgi:archaemetzincin
MPTTWNRLPGLTALCLLLVSQACDPSRAGGIHPGTPRAAAPVTPIIRILPLGHAPKALVDQTAEDLRKVFPTVSILPAESMPAQAWFAPRKRWRADTLIGWMSRRASDNEVWLGITTEDISITKKGQSEDFGIMGLGRKPGRACVASNQRVKDKSQFPKIVIHELGHTAGLPHCLEVRCLMRAANGKDHTREIDGFCANCRTVLLRKGWRI